MNGRLAWLGLVFLIGCQGERAVKTREFERIAYAIERVRLAPNQAKSAPLELLREVECARFCKLKMTCLNAYEEHVEALGSIEEARRLIGTKEHELAARELQLALRELDSAKTGTTACAALEGELARELDQ